MTVRNCWASGITGGRGGDIFHDVIEVASNQHLQFLFLFLFEFLFKAYPLSVLSIIWVITARNGHQELRGREGGDIFHNVMKIASNQHIQFSVLFLVVHGSNSQDSVSRKSSENRLLVCKFSWQRGSLMTSHYLRVDLRCRFLLTSFCHSKQNSTLI